MIDTEDNKYGLGEELNQEREVKKEAGGGK